MSLTNGASPGPSQKTTSSRAPPLRRGIEFTAGNVVVRGWLRVPESPGPHPLVILAHGLGGLKEWTIPEVADALVKSGIAAMAFDYRNFGDSDGSPREEVDHCGQIEDWRSAITFAASLPDIDEDRIGIWGTSLGGRNVLAVAALDRRVKCVFAQVPLISSTTELAALMCGCGTVDEYFRKLAKDRLDRANGEQPMYVQFENDPNMEHGSYWATFGEEERRNWNPRVTLRSFEPCLAGDIRHLMKLIAPTPLRLLGAEADTFCPMDQLREAFDLALEPKSMVTVPGHHYSVYTVWKDKSITAAREWFVEHLTPGASTLEAE